MQIRLLIVAGAVMALAACARGQDAEAAFESQYGAECRRVAATGDKADDVRLAGKLLAAAKEARWPAMQAALCGKAYALGSATGEGYRTAGAAMNLLAEAQPARRPECRQEFIELLQRAYNASRGSDRAPAADAFIEALMLAAEELGESNEHAAAIDCLRRAGNVASATRSGLRDKAAKALAAMQAEQKRAQEVTAMANRVTAAPADTAARERLVWLYVLERNDANSAAKFLDANCSEQLRTYVPLAAKELPALEPVAAMQVGDWYRAVLGKASGPAQAALLHRARGCYEYFLARHSREDDAYAAASRGLEKVMEELARRNASVEQGRKAPDYWAVQWKRMAASLQGTVPAGEEVAPTTKARGPTGSP